MTFKAILQAGGRLKFIDTIYFRLLASYAPTLIQPWSWINVSSRLIICKMLRKTELKSRSISF